jgi:hypothetical protein
LPPGKLGDKAKVTFGLPVACWEQVGENIMFEPRESRSFVPTTRLKYDCTRDCYDSNIHHLGGSVVETPRWTNRIKSKWEHLSRFAASLQQELVTSFLPFWVG